MISKINFKSQDILFCCYIIYKKYKIIGTSFLTKQLIYFNQKFYSND